MLKDVSESSILYGLMMMNSSGLQSRFLSLQITIGIGNEVRESTVQLSQMVRECFREYLVCHFGLTSWRCRTTPLQRLQASYLVHFDG